MVASSAVHLFVNLISHSRFPKDEELSIAASEGELLSSKAEDSPGLPPSSVTTQAECDRVGSSTFPGSQKHWAEVESFALSQSLVAG